MKALNYIKARSIGVIQFDFATPVLQELDS